MDYEWTIHQHCSFSSRRSAFCRAHTPYAGACQTVLDPRGVYGALAIRAPSEDEARAIASGDPSVKGGLNQIEVAEMRIAFLPKGRD